MLVPKLDYLQYIVAKRVITAVGKRVIAGWQRVRGVDPEAERKVLDTLSQIWGPGFRGDLWSDSSFLSQVHAAQLMFGCSMHAAGISLTLQVSELGCRRVLGTCSRDCIQVHVPQRRGAVSVLRPSRGPAAGSQH